MSRSADRDSRAAYLIGIACRPQPTRGAALVSARALEPVRDVDAQGAGGELQHFSYRSLVLLLPCSL